MLNPVALLSTAPDIADSIIWEVVLPVKVPIFAKAIVTDSAWVVDSSKLSTATILKL